jgi:chorismate dehydratase
VKKLRIAAISFLNPAPLLYDFEHSPHRERLAARYDIHYTLPSQCAAQLASGEADLGLVPIASLPLIPDIAVVPGCTIASLEAVRSIQLVVRPGLKLEDIRTVATDAASRSSAAYVRILLKHFYGNTPDLHEEDANLPAMLSHSDAALLIGDPALLALEEHNRQHHFPDHTWIDVAKLWRKHTQLPWVAAVWAVRRAALEETGIMPRQLTRDLQQSRDAGLEHTEDLVAEWTPRLPLLPDTIRHYLSENIHYILDAECVTAVHRFFHLAEKTGTLPAYKFQLLDEPK